MDPGEEATIPSGKEQLSLIDKSSGDMPSLAPVHHPQKVLGEDEEDEFIDETLSERLWGLTEMFPEGVRTFADVTTKFTWATSKFLYSKANYLSWFLASSACIIALPVMIESERAQMEEQHLQQQRQILLGPSAAVSSQPKMTQFAQ